MISRKSYVIYFYLCFIIFLMVRYFNGLFLFQISENPIRSPRVDLVVWTTQLTGIPDLLSIFGIGLLIDLLIIALPFVILFRTFRNRNTYRLIMGLTILFGLYVLFIYCYPTLSIRKYLGLILIPIAFIFSSKERYHTYLELMRYYVIFIFTSASLWKIVRGVAWDPTHMQLSLKAQHIDNFVQFPNHYITQLLSTIIDNPTQCSILFGAAILSQIAFFIGFFTKKYDRFLAFLLIIFVISDYLVMRIEYWEFVVFLPLFYKWELNSSYQSSSID